MFLSQSDMCRWIGLRAENDTARMAAGCAQEKLTFFEELLKERYGLGNGDVILESGEIQPKPTSVEPPKPVS